MFKLKEQNGVLLGFENVRYRELTIQELIEVENEKLNDFEQALKIASKSIIEPKISYEELKKAPLSLKDDILTIVNFAMQNDTTK